MDPGFRGQWKVNRFSDIQNFLKSLDLEILMDFGTRDAFTDLIFLSAGPYLNLENVSLWKKLKMFSVCRIVSLIDQSYCY